MTQTAPSKSPQIITTGTTLRKFVERQRLGGRTVGFVPTMGALHEGHLSLVDAARSECDVVVASIFVNPTQFAPTEDFNQYPRDLERDTALLGSRGCDVVFAPSIDEMYPPGHTTSVEVGPLGGVLEGAYRPTHFRGVATVVLKLFHLAPVDRAYFGRKDYQQTLVIGKMVDDLNVPIELRICPIVRDEDGLAMSSRNAYLSPSERQSAVALFRALRLAQELVDHGERSVSKLEAQMRGLIESAGGITLQYIAFVADGSVDEVKTVAGPTTIALAAHVGPTRLIDNVLVAPPA